MRIKPIHKIFLFLFLLCAFVQETKASHLYGGEMTYEYLGPTPGNPSQFRYRITLKHYVNCVGNDITSNVTFNYYNFNGTNSGSLIKSQGQGSTVSPALPLPIPGNCAIATPCVMLRTFVQVVDLPLSFNGYYVTVVASARNVDILNIDPGNLSLYMQMPPPNLLTTGSKSPVFTDTAVVVIFAGDTTSIINSAFDADGDKLIYSFNTPFGFNTGGTTFTTPPQSVTYKPGYSFAQPFGAGGYASISASTGLAKYFVPSIPGNTNDRKYVISMQVKEYRTLPGIGDILIGSTIRDIQLVVKDVPPNSNTKPNITYTGPQTINITEGQAIPPINFTFTDPNAGQLLTVSASSPLLDGAGGKNATLSPASLNNLPSGTTATFNYTSVCGEANSYPLNITVQDNACPPLSKVLVLTINVDPYVGPQKIFGDTTVCSGVSELYRVAGKASAIYNWRLQGGGTILGNVHNDSIIVNWTTPGRYKLTAIETNTGNCRDSVSFFVNVSPGLNLNVNATATAVCVGTPVTLTATGGTTYTWTNGSTTFTGSTLTVTPNATTTYSVSSTNATGCVSNNSVTVTVNPLPAVIGIDRTVCLGNSGLLTANALPGVTFSWSDGINTYNGNNISVTPTTTTTYTLTGINTTTGCSNTDQVTLTVVPSPAPSLAFLNTAYCKDAAPVNLPAGTGGSTITYAIGPNNATVLNPATLPAGTYTVSMTEININGCTTTVTKSVTINALPTPSLAFLNTAYCKDAAPVNLPAGTGGSTVTYTIGANSATVLNPATLAAGNYTVTMTELNSSNCSATVTKSVTINALPTPSLAFLNAAYCKDAAPVNLPAGTGGSTITYSIGSTSNATVFNPATLAAGTYVVTMNEINSNNCSASTTKSVTVNALPAPLITGLNAAYCANEPAVPLTANLAGSTFTINGATAFSLNPATLGVGTYTVLVTNTNAATGCTGTSTQTVTIKAVPAANFGALAAAYCKNAPAFPLNNITGSTFTIDGTAATSLDPATLSVGNHTVSVTTTSTPDNCSITATRTVTINAIPTPSLAFLNSNYCQNNGVVTLPAGTGISYAVNGTAAASLNPASLTVGPNTVSITETNTTNCTVTVTRIITIDPVPLADPIAGPTSICPGLTGIVYQITNPRQTNYQWTVSAGNGTIVSGNGTSSIVVNWNGAAAATITAKPVNAQGCIGPVTTLPITINPILITPQPIGPTSICFNQANQIRYVMPNPTKGSTFTWTVPGGTIASSNTKGDTIYVNWTSVGVHNIVVQEASTGTVNCFGNSVPLPITILASPSATLPITGPVSVCANEPGITYSLTGAGAASNLSWTITHNGNTTSPITGTGTTPLVFPPSVAGQYTLSVIETNTNGCAGVPITKVITVTPRPVADTIYGEHFICPENIGSTHLFYVKGPVGSTYNWQVTGGTFAPTTNDSVYVTFSASAPIRNITVTPVSPTGCPGTPYTLNLTLDAATVVLSNVSINETNEKTIELTLQMPNNTANQQQIDILRKEAASTSFVKVGTINNTTTTFTDTNVQPNGTSYIYRLESRNECGTVLQSDIHQTMLLIATGNEAAKEVTLKWNAYRGWGTNGVKSYDIYLKADNGTYQLERSVGANDTIFTLSKVSGKGFNECFRIKANGTNNRVSWSNPSCLSFENPLKFYNIFTPNGDNQNDLFVIENVLLYPGNELAIYNRWGTEVYRTKNYQNNWDGKNQSAGVYYYLLTLPDGRNFKGWVEIVK